MTNVSFRNGKYVQWELMEIPRNVTCHHSIRSVNSSQTFHTNMKHILYMKKCLPTVQFINEYLPQGGSGKRKTEYLFINLLLPPTVMSFILKGICVTPNIHR